MSSWLRSTLVLVVIAVGSPLRVNAQEAHQWSSDAIVGAAIVGGGKFFNNGRAAAHLSVADRVLQRGRFGTYAEVGYDWFGQFGIIGANPDLICVADNPGGGCEPDFPRVSGPNASIGLVYAPVTAVETRLGVGGAAYSVDGTRVGAAIAQLDGALFPGDHLALVAGARLAVIPRYRHDRLALLPLLIGVRFR